MSRISAAINDLVVCVEAGLSPAIEGDEKKDDTSDGQTTKSKPATLRLSKIPRLNLPLNSKPTEAHDLRNRNHRQDPRF
jgi:hypothetical protein